MATIDMKVYGTIDELKQARASLGTPAALNEAIVATGIDALFVLLEGGTVVFEETPMRLVPADVALYRMVDRFKEEDPDPWINGSEQCMTGNHLYVPLFPDDSEVEDGN